MEFATRRSLMYCSAFPLLPWLCFSLAWSIKHPWHLVLTLVAGGDFWQICIFRIYSSPEILLSFFPLVWGITDFSKLPSIPSVLYTEQDSFPQSLRAKIVEVRDVTFLDPIHQNTYFFLPHTVYLSMLVPLWARKVCNVGKKIMCMI